MKMKEILKNSLSTKFQNQKNKILSDAKEVQAGKNATRC